MTQTANLPQHASYAQPEHGAATDAAWRGRILSICDPASNQLPYFIFVPSRIAPDAVPVVSIHGWTRNAGEHAFRLAKHAEDAETVLIAPLFSKMAHKHYQRLEIRTDEFCPAAQFDVLLRDVAAQFQINTSRINVFGFSGGAQFAHRYALMRPGRVNKMVLMSAGWYTFPDPESAFPLGTGPSKVLGDRGLYLKDALRIPTCVLVGGRDVNRDESLKTGDRIDRMQGFTRVERAERWTNAMMTAAKSGKLSSEFELKIIDRAKHDFGRCIENHQLGDIIFDWFIPKSEGAEL